MIRTDQSAQLHEYILRSRTEELSILMTNNPSTFEDPIYFFLSTGLPLLDLLLLTASHRANPKYL